MKPEREVKKFGNYMELKKVYEVPLDHYAVQTVTVAGTCLDSNRCSRVVIFCVTRKNQRLWARKGQFSEEN